MKNEKSEVGQTVEVDMYFKLRSTSPCEVEVCDSHISMQRTNILKSGLVWFTLLNN